MSLRPSKCSQIDNVSQERRSAAFHRLTCSTASVSMERRSAAFHSQQDDVKIAHAALTFNLRIGQPLCSLKSFGNVAKVISGGLCFPQRHRSLSATTSVRFRISRIEIRQRRHVFRKNLCCQSKNLPHQTREFSASDEGSLRIIDKLHFLTQRVGGCRGLADNLCVAAIRCSRHVCDCLFDS